jgi:hypothetical protein
MPGSYGKYWGGQIVIDPHEALMQQGLSFTASKRNAALADDAVARYLFDVPNIMHSAFHLTVAGDCWLDFYSVTSYTVGAGSSLTAFNRNTEFKDINSFTVLPFHTPSLQAGSLGIFAGIIPAGAKQNATGGKRDTDELHLHAGIYVLDITNKSGAAIDVGMSVTWEELHNE